MDNFAKRVITVPWTSKTSESSIAISTSNIIKITAIRKKKRDENGSRAEFFGSNLHSNGDLFSRTSFIFLEISVVRIIIAVDSRIVLL
jgi:hypothetical protein